jgi:hypothetical protein
MRPWASCSRRSFRHERRCGWRPTSHHPTSLAVANRDRGYVHSLRGQMETALPFLERPLAIAREHELSQATIFTSDYLAYALLSLGERERGLVNVFRRSPTPRAPEPPVHRRVPVGLRR